MSKTILFDLETDGLLKEVSTIHCLVLADTGTEEIECYHNDPHIQPCHGSLSAGLERLQEADILSGHNILGYDLPVLRKLEAWAWPVAAVEDTLVHSRLVYSDRKERDFALNAAGKLDGKFIGQHSLAAWGQRLGEHKGDYDGGWEQFSQEMLDYCIQDVRTNLKLYHVLKGRVPQYEADGYTTSKVEHRFSHQLDEQERRGAPIDEKRGMKLLDELVSRREELKEEIQEDFPPLKIPHKLTSKGNPRMLKCKYRNTYEPDRLEFFNPGSRMQLAARLQKKYRWVPKELTAKNNPVMQERILLELGELYPESKRVAEYLIVNARIGILQDGPNSYFNLAEDGVLHGRTIHIGTVTHRCAHSKPNLGNVTSIRKPYGKEMRSLFIPFPGMVQAGFDADGLELRMLAHYLAEFDGGAYGRAVHSGDKSRGTDPHSLHAAAVSRVVSCDRDRGKTATYAYLYGAGDFRLGKTFEGGAKLGEQIRSALENNIPGLRELQLALEMEHMQNKGSLISLDGRRIGVRHEHARLNSKLQAAGAVVMKWVCVVLEDLLVKRGIEYGVDFLQTGMIHDEVQGSLHERNKAGFTECVDMAFMIVTDLLGLRVPVVGTTAFGESWADTH